MHIFHDLVISKINKKTSFNLIKMAKNKSTSNDNVQSIFFELSNKIVAEELKKDLIAWSVPAEAVNLKKVRNKNAYKLTIADGMTHITKVIRMLHSPEYDLDFPEIEELLKIKIEI